MTQLENAWEFEFRSWMDEMLLPEILEWIMTSQEFAVLAEQIWLDKTAFAEFAAATFAGWIKCRKLAAANLVGL